MGGGDKSVHQISHMWLITGKGEGEESGSAFISLSVCLSVFFLADGLLTACLQSIIALLLLLQVDCAKAPTLSSKPRHSFPWSLSTFPFSLSLHFSINLWGSLHLLHQLVFTLILSVLDCELIWLVIVSSDCIRWSIQAKKKKRKEKRAKFVKKEFLCFSFRTAWMNG